MKKKLLLTMGISWSMFGWSQQMDLPVTFEGTSIEYGVIGFEGAEASTIEVDPTNAANTVVKVIKSASAQPWAGTTVTNAAEEGFATQIPFDAANTFMNVRVWSPDAGIPVRLKVEDANDPTRSVETDAFTTTSGNWETLTFNFANEGNGTAEINFAFVYNKASIFFNYGTNGATAGEKTYFFDDVAFGAGAVTLTQMNLPVTFEESTVDYGVIGFEGAEASTIGADPTDATNTVVKVIKSATAQPWAGTTVSNVNGDGFSLPIPFSVGNTTMRVAVWSPDAGVRVRLKVEDHNNSTRSVETDAFVSAAGVWEVLTFDFATEAAGTSPIDYTYSYDKASVFFNYGIDGATTGEKIYYFDNLEYIGLVLVQMDLPVTFEDAGVDYGVIGFEGAEASTIETDPTDGTNTVVKVIKSAAAQPWAGTTITAPAEEGLLNAIPFTITNTKMSLRVWSPDAGIPVRLKVEDHNNAARSVETEATTTTASAWETLEFDFSNEANGTAIIDLNYVYDKASVFFNFGTNGATTGEKTYYFDDLAFVADTIVEPATFDIKFSVDMNNVTDNFTTPEVNGTFNNWCGGCAPMTDANADGIWELTIPLPAGTYEFKYAYDSWAGSETLADGQSCVINNNGFINRSLTVSEDLELPVSCWASCVACVADTNTTGPFNVVFRVDMNNVTAAFTTPEVNGEFNNWCGGCAPMTDDNADGIWELTIPLDADTFEFKFAYDNWADGGESLIAGTPCTQTTGNFTNRLLVVTGDVVLPVVCWNSCNSCNSTEGPFNVTFRVDVSDLTETFTTPEVNGQFNNWCGGCAPMSDANADGVWELTIPLAADTFEFKFAYDNWAGQESLVSGSSCTNTTDGFTNRRIIVTENTELPIVCWASCEACLVGINDNFTTTSLQIFPNPAQNQLNVKFETDITETLNVSIFDALGKLVSTQTINPTQQFDIATNQFVNGVYFIRINSNQVVVSQSFVVQH